MRNVRDEIEHISNFLLFDKLTSGNILVFRAKGEKYQNIDTRFKIVTVLQGVVQVIYGFCYSKRSAIVQWI